LGFFVFKNKPQFSMHLKKKNEKFMLNVPGIPYGLVSKTENKPNSKMDEAS